MADKCRLLAYVRTCAHVVLKPLYAQNYEPGALLELFPEPPIRQATETLIRISQITEDKAMYDAREKLIRDRQWALNAARMEGEAKGRMEGEAKGEIKGEIGHPDCLDCPNLVAVTPDGRRG